MLPPIARSETSHENATSSRAAGMTATLRSVPPLVLYENTAFTSPGAKLSGMQIAALKSTRPSDASFLYTEE